MSLVGILITYILSISFVDLDGDFELHPTSDLHRAHLKGLSVVFCESWEKASRIGEAQVRKDIVRRREIKISGSF